MQFTVLFQTNYICPPGSRIRTAVIMLDGISKHIGFTGTILAGVLLGA